MVESLVPSDRTARSASPAVEPFPTRRSIRAAELSNPKLANSKLANPKLANAAKRAPAAMAAPAYADRPASTKKRVSIQHRIVGIATVLLVPGILIGSSIPASAFGTNTDNTADVASAADPQSLIVDTALDGSALSRDSFDATTTKELAEKKQAALRAAAAATATTSSTSSSAASSGDYSTVTPRAAGDDYPYRSSGGLSPMGYVIRQCTDFVAWRLNRDAGYTHDYKYVWSMMTPNGGSAYAWAAAWRAHNWKTSHTPVKGSVAWFAGNHVAYVKAVHGDQIDLEEYNWGGDASYHTRTISASDVALFLYPPP